jgi:pimeloyl-ACP methyl ester carboxylesterase
MHLPPTLQAIQTALDQGNAALVRDLLFQLGPEDRRALNELLGTEPAERLYRTARRGTRAIKRGRVVVLPGITGSELLAEYADGKSRLLWIDFISLVLGRSLALLTLSPAGEPADPSVRITPRGFVLGWYLNLVTSLQNEWDVLPVSYDWRLDIDHSADALAEKIARWARNEPAHIVAHSMGGLASRRMIQRHPDLWEAMDDRDGRHRGGRLVMLGTPNRGSYSIPLTLTGDELMVRLLDVADLTKGRRGVLARLNSFPGTYQMLPSPEVRSDTGGASDDHVRLFDPAAWGGVPVQPPLLARAHRFARELHGVVDADRMVYVAGYGQATPSAVRVRAPGRFEYQRTTMGDGRVPHALGLLPGVPAYYVRESHGDLPKNEAVLASLTDLLLSGKTAQLETSPRVVRLLARGATGAVTEPPGRWHDPGEFVDERAVDELRLLVRSQRRGAVGPEPVLRAERILADAAGLPAAQVDAARAVARGRAPRARAAGEPAGRTLPLAVEVVWGDITRVESDVCAVGQYQGLEPQRAELAIDRYLVTGPLGSRLARGDDRLVLTRLTHRGVLRGELGQVAFFPSARGRKHGGPSIVAIAGMGYPGTFTRQALQQLSAQLADAVSTLPDAETLSMVLIGSGEGSLDVGEALTGLIAGLEQWAAAAPTGSAPRLRRLRIVERALGKAREIQGLLLEKLRLGELVTSAIRLDPAEGVVVGPGGAVEQEYAAALHLVASGGAGTPRPVRDLLRGADPRIEGRNTLDLRVEAALEELREGVLGTGRGRVPGGEPLLEAADRLRSLIRVDTTEPNLSTRLSFLRSEQGVRLAAITDRATVSERAIAVDFGLIRQQIEVMQTEEDPQPEDVNRVARLLRRLLLPRDFRDLLYRSDALIFDVDRAMAAVPWEIMQCGADQPLTETQLTCPEEPEEPRHVALEMLVARQLRTTLSPSPQPDFEPTGQLEALVVADPDDSLEHARAEGQAVAALLRQLGCCVRLLSGSKGGDGAEPASRSAVIDFLASRRRPLDLLHYAGHGDFDPADPSRVGWVFADGILGPNELRLALEAMPPLMVVSNSCLTGLLSETRRGRTAKSDTWDELGLVPALADIFLQQGVRHFIAANRPIYDQGAVDFATMFYRTLLAPPGAFVGDAVRAARRALHAQEEMYGPLWAAYHHYGDPSARLRPGR